jgi:hypothetical protein
MWGRTSLMAGISLNSSKRVGDAFAICQAFLRCWMVAL